MLRIRNACITSFAEVVAFDKEQVSYLVYHREKCPDTGKLHYHIYAEFKCQLVLSSIKKVFNDETIHIEKRLGSQKQAIDYVIKDKNEFEVFEYGERKKQGERNDIKCAVNMIKDNKKNVEIIESCPEVFVKFNRGLEKVRFELLKDKTKGFRKVEVIVLVGKAGSGKTRYVMENEKDLYKLDAGNNVWFDGYEGEKVLLIDDFYGWIKYGHLLNILDGYQLRLDIKGGHTYANWDKVYITSNKKPKKWYSEYTDALERRISKVIKM